MKGTFFSSDFIIDESNNLRFLEFNTDTAVITSTLDTHFSFTDFITLLSDNNITKMTVIFKSFHVNFIDKLESTISTDATFITEFIKIKEDNNTIYPTSVDDEDDRFILRLAYDENALFDSNYCKERVEVLKLMQANDATGSIPEFYIPDGGVNNIITTSLPNSTKVPDIIVKNIREQHQPLKFYKFTDSANSSSIDLITDYSTNNADTGSEYLERYHIHADNLTNNKVQSIREFGIVYGSNIEYVRLASYKIDSLFELPDISSYTYNGLGLELPKKHYYEYTSNFIKAGEIDGIVSSEQVQKVDNTFEFPYNLAVSESLKSYFLSGSPDTDDSDVFYSWSFAGSTFPANSEVTMSRVQVLSSGSIDYGVVLEVNLTSGDSIYVGDNKALLTYDSGSNFISFKSAFHTTASGDYLYNDSGSLYQISSSNVCIIDAPESYSLYRIDTETTDTYFISSSNPFIVHNAPCFIAGTPVHTEEGIKNIEDVKVGDKVITYNHDNDVAEYKEVQSTMVKENENVVSYILENGTKITGTPDHPLFVLGKGYSSYTPKATKEDSGMDVEQILIGDEILHLDGYGVTIDDIIEHEETHTVYNLDKVEDNHNFYVWDFLAHNRGGPPPPFCFIAGTQISLANGDIKNIEDVVKGDEVLSFNEETKEIESNKVFETHQPIHNDLVKYTLSDGTIITSTFDHPFYVNELELASYLPSKTNALYDIDKEVQQIKLGDVLKKVDDSIVTIENIEVQEEVDTKTYLLRVNNNNNFYANQILVHNK